MTRGERVIAFIERFCIVPEGKLIGQPMRLDPFQKDFILAVYDNPAGTDMAILSIARKNGKTGLIAGILLAHLVGPEAVQNTQIVSGALSREQAAIVFNLAVKMVNLNPKLQEIVHITPSGKKLIGLPCNVEYKALSAEGKTTHGLSPILAILDETGQVIAGEADDGVWDVFPFFWTPQKTLEERTKTDRAPYDVWVREGLLRTTPGASVDYSFVVADIAEIIGDFDLTSMAFDRWRIDQFRKDADAIGLSLPLVEFGQGFKDMGPAVDTLESLMLNGRVRHGMHPVLTMCAVNAVVVKDAAGNRKLDKSKATGRIDGMVAMTMSVGAANGEVTEQGGDFDDFIFRPLSM